MLYRRLTAIPWTRSLPWRFAVASGVAAENAKIVERVAAPSGEQMV